jgi:hypothetical protein
VQHIEVNKKLADYAHPAFMPKTVTQWRLLINIEEIELTDQHARMPHALANGSAEVTYRFIEKRYKHTLKVPGREDNRVGITCTKMFYLFAVDSKEIKQLC